MNAFRHFSTVVAIAALSALTSSVHSAVITIRDDQTLLRDGQPWFPIFENYNLVEQGTHVPRQQYYESAYASGFNGLLMMGSGGNLCCYGLWSVDNSTSSDIGNQDLCDHIPGRANKYRVDCNFATPVAQQLNPLLTSRGWNLFDDGASFIPYNFLGWETDTLVFCSAIDPIAKRHTATDHVLEV